MRTLAFFNNTGGVGKTTLVYHFAHILAERGVRVVIVDLDPQSNLTAMCLSEERLEDLWPESAEHPETILGNADPSRLLQPVRDSQRSSSGPGAVQGQRTRVRGDKHRCSLLGVPDPSRMPPRDLAAQADHGDAGVITVDAERAAGGPWLRGDRMARWSDVEVFEGLDVREVEGARLLEGDRPRAEVVRGVVDVDRQARGVSCHGDS